MNPHLDRIDALQQAFKPGVINAIGVKILTHALAHGSVWPDEIEIEGVPEDDRNCIGNAWRDLKRIGILRQTDDHRCSKAEGAKGRIIFRYALVDRPLAKTFVERNTAPSPAVLTQPELIA